MLYQATCNLSDKNGWEIAMGIEQTIKLAMCIFMIVMGIAFIGIPDAHADIYVKKMPDGTQMFSNCPLGKGWSVYLKEQPRRTEMTSYRGSYPNRTKWDRLISEIALGNGVDPILVKHVIAMESGFEPTALSPKGAMGLMQLMPATANELGVADPWDPEQNIKGGIKYLSWLLKKYNGNLEKALAAYNAGPSAVDSYKGIPPYQETQNYVRTILSRYTGQSVY